jgi:hypothetical protein
LKSSSSTCYNLPATDPHQSTNNASTSADPNINYVPVPSFPSFEQHLCSLVDDIFDKDKRKEIHVAIKKLDAETVKCTRWITEGQQGLHLAHMECLQTVTTIVNAAHEDNPRMND